MPTEFDRKIANLEAEIRDCEHRLQEMQIELRVWLEAKKLADAQRSPLRQARKQTTKRTARESGKPKPGQAVVALLEERPGLEMVEILDALEGNVDTTAKNERHNLRTTVFNLTKRGLVERDSEDKYSATKNGSDA